MSLYDASIESSRGFASAGFADEQPTEDHGTPYPLTEEQMAQQAADDEQARADALDAARRIFDAVKGEHAMQTLADLKLLVAPHGISGLELYDALRPEPVLLDLGLHDLGLKRLAADMGVQLVG